MIGNVSTNAISPIIYPQKFKIDYLKDVVPITNVVDIPAFLVATTKDFDAQKRARADRLRQEKSRKSALRHGRAGQLSALRHGLFRQNAPAIST